MVFFGNLSALLEPSVFLNRSKQLSKIIVWCSMITACLLLLKVLFDETFLAIFLLLLYLSTSSMTRSIPIWQIRNKFTKLEKCLGNLDRSKQRPDPKVKHVLGI